MVHSNTEKGIEDYERKEEYRRKSRERLNSGSPLRRSVRYGGLHGSEIRDQLAERTRASSIRIPGTCLSVTIVFLICSSKNRVTSFRVVWRQFSRRNGAQVRRSQPFSPKTGPVMPRDTPC